MSPFHDSFSNEDDNNDDTDQVPPHSSSSNDGIIRESEIQSSSIKSSSSSVHETLKTIAGVAGNVLEWYDFAVFGFFSDTIGRVFFPPDQSEDKSIIESFAVFGGAFLMRPIGGLIIGYIGDIRGRKYALELSIFLMAIATTSMGCLPTYEQIGNAAILLLLIVRMLQGLSVGGQLMSSLVFTLEGHPESRWGLYGSFVMAGANLGTLIGGLVAGGLDSVLTEEQLIRWGWRIPFLSGILISFCGIYLKFFCADDEILPGHHGPSAESSSTKTNNGTHSTTSKQRYRDDDNNNNNDDGGHNDTNFDGTDEYEEEDDVVIIEGSHSSTGRSNNASSTTTISSSDTQHHQQEQQQQVDQPIQDPLPTKKRRPNPLRIAFSRQNFRSLLASSMVPMLWSGGFYLSFVWLAIWMRDDVLVDDAMGINSLSLLLLGVWFPTAGALSDWWGRKRAMTIGGTIFATTGPVFLWIIATYGPQNKWIAFGAQNGMGMSLAGWGAPMCAWLVEAFDPEARLTSVSIGYNVAQAIAGGLSPFLAEVLVDEVGKASPGIILIILGCVALTGLLFVAPSGHSIRHTAIASVDDHDDDDGDENERTESIRTNIELGEIT